MMSNDSIVNVKTKRNRVNKIKKTVINKLRIYVTIYHTYQLLYYKVHIQMTSNDSIINEETKNNKVSKTTKLHSIQLVFPYNISHLPPIIL